VEHCVAYGPGILELAHQPDEWCGVQDLVDSTKILALAALDLAGGPSTSRAARTI
jgi:succinyl-diaminopimelate desuccinylase